MRASEKNLRIRKAMLQEYLLSAKEQAKILDAIQAWKQEEGA